MVREPSGEDGGWSSGGDHLWGAARGVGEEVAQGYVALAAGVLVEGGHVPLEGQLKSLWLGADLGVLERDLGAGSVLAFDRGVVVGGGEGLVAQLGPAARAG